MLDNLKKLCTKSNVVVRIPVIPGHNHSKEKMVQIARKVAEACPSRVDLLPFHRLGSGKYKAMNMEYDFFCHEPLKKSDLEQYIPVFEHMGLKCQIEK